LNGHRKKAHLRIKKAAFRQPQRRSKAAFRVSGATSADYVPGAEFGRIMKPSVCIGRFIGLYFDYRRIRIKEVKQ
jgi:hypothetical protein